MLKINLLNSIANYNNYGNVDPGHFYILIVALTTLKQISIGLPG